MADPTALADAAAGWADIHLAMGALYCLAGGGEDAPSREELAGLCLILYEATATRHARTEAALAASN